MNKGNFIERYLKQGPSFDKTLTKFFIRPNLMWNGGNKINFLGGSGSHRVFLVPRTKFFLSLKIQRFCFTRLSHLHITKGILYNRLFSQYFFITLKSPMIYHLCTSYWMCFNNSFMLSNISFIWSEWASRMEMHTFPLCSNCLWYTLWTSQ